MTLLLQSTNERMRPWLTSDDKAAVMAVLDSGDLMSGKQVAAFEEELAAYFGKRHAVCVSSGTAALECAFATQGTGDRIHPNGFIAILSAACAAGRVPLCDREFGVRTALMGEVANSIDRIADCAHTFHRTAATATLSCFSFNANKFIACCGGAVVTNDEAWADLMRVYRNHGRLPQSEKPWLQHPRPGRHLRMPEISAALGRSQLKRIDEILARRKQVARWYDEITGGNLADTRESWFLYPVPDSPVLAKKRRGLADFRLFGTATQEDRETALLPIFPLMTKEDCEEVCCG